MSLRVLIAEGPAQRKEWFYGPDGDGHATLGEFATYGLRCPEAVQPVVEYVGPWQPVEEQA